MCLNKVYVRDLIHYRKGGSYFPCGHCKPCRQLLANRRANKIRNHDPKNTTCYFVTLTYSNEFVPYVNRDELRSSLNSLRDPANCDPVVHVYRDWNFLRNFGTCMLRKHTKIIDQLDLSGDLFCKFRSDDLLHYKPLPNGDIKGILGLRTKHKNNIFTYDPVKISVAYTPDFQRFIKRLRSNYEYAFKKKLSLSYFYAPEYGPTTHRFHIHCLLWFESRFTQAQIKSFILKAWPFCDRKRLSDYIEVARCPASYLASYVNKSDDVPQSLFDLSPTKCSHSLAFGFNEDVFGFKNIVQNFQNNGRVVYTATCIDETGVPAQRDLLYPQYVNHHYFPKVKGYNRLSYTTLRNVYRYPEKFLSLAKYPVSRNSQLEDQFESSLVDVYGNRVIMTLNERNYYLNCITRFLSRFRSIGLNSRKAFNFLYSYYKRRASYIYLSQFDDISSNHMVFYNLPDVYTGIISAPTITPYLDTVLDLKEIDCNHLPIELHEARLLTEKYNKNCKQREINALYPITR